MNDNFDRKDFETTMNTNRAPGLTMLTIGLLTLLAPSTGGCGAGEATGESGTSASQECTGSTVSCKDGTLTGCEAGTVKTASCEDQCVADGFEPANQCGQDSARCGCGNPTDPICTGGINAACACLEGSPACQGTAALDSYTRCHRDPSSETATILKCFAQYVSGDMVACDSAILACGNAGPSTGCTADVDCGHCERCELSTGNCLTKVGCN